MVFAPVLQDVAARMSGSDPSQRVLEPERWAYSMSEAVALVQPDWVVTHHDLSLEATALAAEATNIEDVADVAVAGTPALGGALTLTNTLAGIYRGGIVAASVTGPASIATRLASGEIGSGADEDDVVELLDICGDLVAEFAAALTERGAQRVIVWEDSAGPFVSEDVMAAQSPLIRRLDTLDVPILLVAADGIPLDPYAVHASPSAGRGAVLVGPDELASAHGLGAPDDVVLTDGPIPARFDLATLAGIGQRTAAAT